jgi:glutathione S-transferase
LQDLGLISDSGLRPNPKDAPGYFTDYSIPAIRYEDGSYQMDSWPIAHELEKRYPSPSLHLDSPVTIKVRDQIASILGPVFMQFLPEESWKRAEGPLKELADLLKKHDGPFFLGETVSYADFIFVAALYFVKRLSEEGFQRMIALDPAIPRVYEASGQWFTKDN